MLCVYRGDRELGITKHLKQPLCFLLLKMHSFIQLKSFCLIGLLLVLLGVKGSPETDAPFENEFEYISLGDCGIIEIPVFLE